MNTQKSTQAGKPVWRAKDAKAAVKQGWDLVAIDEAGERLQIQKDGDSTLLANDLEAIAFVQQQARAGDAVAIKALALDWTLAATAADRRKPEPSLYTGDWSHPFGPTSSDTDCRIVVDVANNELVAAQAKDGLKWVWLSRDSLADLADSLFNANTVCEDPEGNGLDPIDVLPDWAAREQAAAAVAVEVPEVRLWFVDVEHRREPSNIPFLLAQTTEPTVDEILGRFSGEHDVRKLRVAGLFNLSHVLNEDPASREALEQYLKFAAVQASHKEEAEGHKAPSIFDTMVPWGINRSPAGPSN